MFTIIVESDTNDADYITSEFTVNEEGFLYIQEICRKIKESKIDYRISVQEYSDFIEAFEGVLTKEEAEWLYDAIPRQEGYGMLESIRFYIGKPVTLL